MKPRVSLVILVLVGLGCGGAQSASERQEVPSARVDPHEVHLGDLRQLTYGVGENAEAYWSFDGKELILQSKRSPYACDQIFRVAADGSAAPELVSTGLGRTTCSYFLPGDQEILYSSTHATSTECPPVPDFSRGYVWPIYDAYDIYRADRDGKNPRPIGSSPGYDAEATVCHDGSIVFTSTRDGDLELYRMDRNGDNVVRLTHTPGYDGGAFFSADCQQIVWRASRPKGADLEEYQKLLAEGLIRPSKLEIFVANADGSEPRQLTYLDAASFAPFFHPSGKRVLFSSNFQDPQKRNFEIYAIGVDGTGLERITYSEGFDGFPMFSPDGTRLAFSSNRNNKVEGETDVYVAEWLEEPRGPIVEGAADRFHADVAWLADDAREGRGIGTAGIDAAADWLGEQFATIGLEEGTGRFQALEVAVAVRSGLGTRFFVGKRQVDAADFVPTSFSANAKVTARTVDVGYGIVDPTQEYDDYKGKDVRGKIALIRRFTPPGKTFADENQRRRFEELHYKAFTAREHGAIGAVIVDWPEATGGIAEAERPLPPLELSRYDGTSIPVIVASRKVAAVLFDRPQIVTLEVALEKDRKPSRNVIGFLPAGKGSKLPGAVVIGAHYDHLGLGGPSSLSPGVREVHNGADDNASGVAGLLEAARELVRRRGELRRDVYFVAFTAEESGLIGSHHFVENQPKELAPIAMINMDMIGRVRDNKVSASGTGTASVWPDLVDRVCAELRVDCTLGGDGYGPSDQTSFYKASVPVLHFFSGAHSDYHKVTDDVDRVNAAGGAQVARIVASIALQTANMADAPVVQKAEAPARGDRGGFGASLGTIPDYAGGGNQPGVLLAGVRPGSAAEKGGLAAGDRIIAIDDTQVQSVQDFVYVLQGAKPGQKARVKVMRAGKALVLDVTYGESASRKH